MIFSQNPKPCNENLVYLNKIFYNDQEKASPILTSIDTSGEGFSQQLTIGQNTCSNPLTTRNFGCNCGCNCSCDCCCDMAITADTTFDITNSYVIVRAFQLTEAAELSADDVTVEGIPITAITRNGNQYVGDLSTIMEEITKCACQSPCANICPGNFIMMTTPGPWTLAATFVIEGNVYGSGPSCQFKLCINTVADTPLPITGGATFAFCGANIPCQISGISPSLIFDFGACAKILNPEITVTCTGETCVPVLTGSLVITPEIELQIVRPSLFNLGDREVQLPCDDLGQCNPCNPDQASCVNEIDNCCCGQSNRAENTSVTCQCCDTNGYGF